MSHPLLCNIRTLFPPLRLSQSQLSLLFKQFCDNAYLSSPSPSSSSSSSPSSSFPYAKVISSLFQNTCISHRHFMFPPEDIHSNSLQHNTDLIEDFNTKAINNFSKLTQDCVNNTVQDIGIQKSNIHTILSYTPLHSSPPYSTKCFNLSELRKDVIHTPVHALASSGGVALLSYASHHVKGNPSHCALTLTAECGSRLWAKGGSFDVALRKMIASDVVKNKEKIYQQIVVASLLGDGVSSGVVVGPEHTLYAKLKNNGKNPFIVDTYSHFVPETLTELGSNLTESGTQVFMSRHLAEVAPVGMIEAVSALLERNKLQKSDIKFWIAHPGGPKILQTVQDTLHMTKNDFRYSWDALAEVGNVSSVSILRAYELCLAENKQITPGTWGVMVAVGPGIRVEAILLRW